MAQGTATKVKKRKKSVLKRAKQSLLRAEVNRGHHTRVRSSMKSLRGALRTGRRRCGRFAAPADPFGHRSRRRQGRPEPECRQSLQVAPVAGLQRAGPGEKSVAPALRRNLSLSALRAQPPPCRRPVAPPETPSPRARPSFPTSAGCRPRRAPANLAPAALREIFCACRRAISAASRRMPSRPAAMPCRDPAPQFLRFQQLAKRPGQRAHQRRRLFAVAQQLVQERERARTVGRWPARPPSSHTEYFFSATTSASTSAARDLPTRPGVRNQLGRSRRGSPPDRHCTDRPVPRPHRLRWRRYPAAAICFVIRAGDPQPLPGSSGNSRSHHRHFFQQQLGQLGALVQLGGFQHQHRERRRRFQIFAQDLRRIALFRLRPRHPSSFPESSSSILDFGSAAGSIASSSEYTITCRGASMGIIRARPITSSRSSSAPE